LEGATACTLNDAGQQQDGQGGSGSAGEAGYGEDDDAGEEETLATEAEREPVAGGENDGVGDEIAGEDPGGFVVGGGEGTSYIRKGDRGDGGVEHLHERGEHDRCGDQPGVYALSDFSGLIGWCARSRGHGFRWVPFGGVIVS